MKETAHKLKSITAFEISGDCIVNEFERLASDDENVAIEAYTNITRKLLTEKTTLADYLVQLLAYSPSKLIEGYIKKEDSASLYAIEYDVSVIKELAKMSAHKIKDYLFGKFSENFIFSLPEYVTGGFDKNADYFIKHISANGSGIYAKYKAFVYQASQLVPVENPDPIRLSDLKKYEAQRNQIIDNTRAFIAGHPADNALLYGDRGTGKSSTVKALLNEYANLRIVQVDKKDISCLPELYKTLKDNPLKFIIFIDDLSFNENDEGFDILKKVLEGSICSRPSNVLIYATTNRRHLIKETESSRMGDNIHSADEIDSNMSLSDRFGLFVTFLAPGKEVYLEIVRSLILDRGIIIDREKLDRCAERFALKRNGRSPRIARQFADSLQSKLALGIDPEKL